MLKKSLQSQRSKDVIIQDIINFIFRRFEIRPYCRRGETMATILILSLFIKF